MKFFSSHLLHKFRNCHSERSEESLPKSGLKQVQRSFVASLLRMTGSTKLDKGVSLIELLIVIGLIGVVTSATTVVSTSAQKRARDAKRKEDAELIMNALTAYAIKHGGTFVDIVGTYPNCTSVARPADGDGVGGDDSCLATFYSTPTPSSGSGKNRWSVLETYLRPYVGSALPVDPKNNSTSWTGEHINLSDSNFRDGFYMVRITHKELTQQYGIALYNCSGGPTQTRSYIFYTPLEDTNDPLTNGARYPLLDNNTTQCKNLRTLFRVAK